MRWLHPLGWSVAVLLAVGCGESPSNGPGNTHGAGGAAASAGMASPGAGAGGSSAGKSAGGSAGMPAGAGRGGSSTAGAPGAGGGPAAGSTSTGGSGGAGASGGSGAVAGAMTAGGTGGDAGAGAGMAGGAGMSPNGAAYPFPQNQRLSRCTYPTAANPDDVRKAYEAWKSAIVTSNGAGGHLRTQRPNSPGAEVNSTVSEGIAYGMLIAVLMDDRMLFDELWKYEQLWANSNGLMDWYINAAGTQRLGTGGATDADEDMAWALVMADRQWGGQGSLDKPYLDYGKALIKAIWDHEIDHGNDEFLLAGDTWGGNIVFNTSYFAPNEYRVFEAVTGETGWSKVIDTGYTILTKSLNSANGNVSNGLVPAWCDVNGAPKAPQNGGATNYQYDAARVPFRIGVDYCFNGDERAKAYLPKISQFFAGVGASKIVDGYDTNGTPHPDPDSDANGPQSAVFVGSGAVGAMRDAQFQSFENDAYALVATGQLLARSSYYNLSWTTLTLAMLTGNFVEYPAK